MPIPPSELDRSTNSPWYFDVEARSSNDPRHAGHDVPTFRRCGPGTKSQDEYESANEFLGLLGGSSQGYNPTEKTGISRVNPFPTGVITHLVSGMNHQVRLHPQLEDFTENICEFTSCFLSPSDRDNPGYHWCNQTASYPITAQTHFCCI